MLIEQVKQLDPIGRYIYFIKERESVRVKKKEGKSKPWTNDIRLQQYRFCNCRRMDDKVSTWLYESWYKPFFNQPSMLMNVILARLINKPETLQYVGFQKQWSSYYALTKLKNYRDTGATVFNGAYIVSTNGLSGDKLDVLFTNLIGPIVKNPPKLDTSSMEKSVSKMTEYWGLSGFLAGQVVADLRWAMKGTWADRNTWASVGPGSRRGMNRLLGRDVDAGMNQDTFISHLIEVVKVCKKNLPLSIHGRLEMIDWQNICCEYDKSERILWGEGKPKQKYQGV